MDNALSMRDNEALMTVLEDQKPIALATKQDSAAVKVSLISALLRRIANPIPSTETLRLSVIRTALNMIPRSATTRETEALESKVPALC